MQELHAILPLHDGGQVGIAHLPSALSVALGQLGQVHDEELRGLGDEEERLLADGLHVRGGLHDGLDAGHWQADVAGGAAFGGRGAAGGGGGHGGRGDGGGVAPVAVIAFRLSNRSSIVLFFCLASFSHKNDGISPNLFLGYFSVPFRGLSCSKSLWSQLLQNFFSAAMYVVLNCLGRLAL